MFSMDLQAYALDLFIIISADLKCTKKTFTIL